MDNVGIIDRFLDVFTTYIDSGFGLLGGEVAFLTSTLIIIDITLAGLFWAWGGDEDILARLIRKTLYIGFFAYLIGNWNFLARIVFESFAGLGLTASGSGISADEFMRPGVLAETGLEAGRPLLEAASELMGYVSFFQNFVQIAVLMLAWAIVLLAFFILAVQLFVTLIEFKLTTLAGFVLIPFALFGKTAFLAERVLGNVVASGIKVLVLAVIVGIGTGLFGEFTAGFGDDQPTLEDALAIVLASLALLGLGIFGPGIATGLVSGAPQLGAGSAAGTALLAGGIGAAGVIGARAGLGAAGSLGHSATMMPGRGGSPTGGMAPQGGGGGAIPPGGEGGGAASASFGSAGRAAAMPSLGQGGATEGSSSTPPASDGPASGPRPSSTVSAGTAPASVSAPTSDQPPAWAARLKQRQAMSHGLTTAAHVVRAGDQGGGNVSVSLQDRKEP